MLSVKANATKERVLTCPLRPPEGVGTRWQGVPHGELIETIEHLAKQRNWRLKDFRGDLSREEADLAASWREVAGPHAPEGFTLSLGVTASNARRGPLRFYVGAVEATTDTAIVIKDWCGPGYTIGVDLPATVSTGLDKWRKAAMNIEHIVRHLRRQRMDKATYEAILLKAGRQGTIAWSRIGKVDRLWRQTELWHSRERIGLTAWALVQAFNRAGLSHSARDQMHQLYRFYQLVEAAVPARIPA